MTESRGPSREGTQGRHQTDFRPARDGISVYFNINDPGRKAASKPSTGAPTPLESENPGIIQHPTIHQHHHRAIKTANEEDEEEEVGKKKTYRLERGVRESAISCK